MKMFDNFICNKDRNAGNLLVDDDWNLYLIDHSRAFINDQDLAVKMEHIDREFWDRMVRRWTKPTIDRSARQVGRRGRHPRDAGPPRQDEDRDRQTRRRQRRGGSVPQIISMRRGHLAPLVLVLTAAWLASATLSPRRRSRIVAIGDVHGAGEAFVSILQRAGLIDAQRRWTGGTTMFVQTGDLLDRGTASPRGAGSADGARAAGRQGRR